MTLLERWRALWDDWGKQWFVVIGRIPFDDEDTAYTFRVRSYDDAVHIFVEQLYGDSDKELPPNWQDVENPEGAWAFITHVIECGEFEPKVNSNY